MSKFFTPFRSIKERWQKLSIAERGAVAINIPLLCLIFSFGGHLFVRQATLKSEHKVEHIQSVLAESRTLLIDMLNAETGVRGYFNTRQKAYLEPYIQGRTKLPKTFDRLDQLIQDHPQQLQRQNTLRQLAQQKLDLLKEGIDKVDRGAVTRDASGLPILRSIEGKLVMDRFRNALTEFETAEQQSLRASYQDLQHLRDVNVLVIILGMAIGCLGVAIAKKLFTDLGNELQARESLLQERNNLIRAVFGNVVDGVVTLDAQGQIESCNHAAIAMFGYDLSTLVGQNWQMLLGKQNPALIPIPTPATIEAGEMGKLWQTMGQRKNGDYFPIEISISKIELDSRQIAIIRDISLRQTTAAKLQARAKELVQLNYQLSRTNATLAARNQELDRFAYVTSHDLKAPLRAIANLAHWITEDLAEDLPPENKHQLELLRGRVDRMESLLDGLLEYSRVGRQNLPIELVNVNELVAAIVKSIDPPSTFKIKIAPNLPTVKTHQLLLKQVFIILINNAIQHHPSPAGLVEITATDLGDHYEFVVTDDGQGIEPQYHEKIYTIFQTLQARDILESTGVGLAIVKKIVETEGGTIRLKSSLGQGATFSFTWLKQPIDSAMLIDRQN